MGVASLALSCAASDPRSADATPIGLHILAPTSVLTTATSVTLDVYDASLVACSGSTLSGPAPTQTVLHLPLAHCSDGERWCGAATIAEDGARPLTWFVSGSESNGQAVFQGCTTQAVNQNPLQVAISVVPIIPGAVCGDGVVLPPETCDPGAAGGSDEACDATTCQTLEVIASNGQASNLFYRGNEPDRKLGVSLRWIDPGKLYVLWSDLATGGGGGDGLAQLTVRRLSSSVTTTDSSVSSLLQHELRLQSGAFDASGDNVRGGNSFLPTLQPIDDSKMLAVFTSTPNGDVSHIYASMQQPNLNGALSADQMLTAPSTAAEQPATAEGSDGGILIAFVESGTIHSIFRDSSGNFGSDVPVSTSGSTSASPRVAAVDDGYVVVWFDGDDIVMSHVSTTGVPDATPTVVNGERAGIQDQPDVASLPSGGFLVAFRDASSGAGTNIRVQKYDATRAAIGTEAAAAINDKSTTGAHEAPAVASGTTSDGEPFYAVVWYDDAQQQIAGRIVSGDQDGFLYNPIDGSLDECAIGVGQKTRSSPAVSVGGSPAYIVVGWNDENDGDPGGDDDRVRVRRLPLPPAL